MSERFGPVSAPPGEPAPLSSPPGPPPVVLAVARELVTRHRLRLSDQRDGRMGALLGQYVLAAGSWTGSRSRLVAFWDPAHEDAAADVAARVAEATAWGLQRLETQGAAECEVLLVALRRVDALALPPPPPRVTVAVAWVDAAAGEAGAITPVPGDLPQPRELRTCARAARDGAPIPTLAAIDLLERQTVAAGYQAPAPGSLAPRQPLASYGLAATFIAIFVIEQLLPHGELAITIAGDFVNTTQNATAQLLLGSGLDWWRYVSASFLHAGLLHVAVNTWSVIILGRLVEQLYGRLGLLAAFLVSAAGGWAFWLAMHLAGIAGVGTSVGASGGLCGLLGLVAVLGRVQGRDVPKGLVTALRNQVLLNVMLLVVLGGVFSGGLNNWAHAGGFLTGVLLGLVLPPLAAVGGRDLRRVERVVALGVIAVAALALLVAAAHVPDALTTVQAVASRGN